MKLEFFKTTFIKNLPYKIVALILTVTLWVVIAKEKDLEIGLKAKLLIKTKAGLVASGDIPGEITVRVSGPKIFLQPLMLRQLEVNVDISEANEGETTFNIVQSMFDIPWGVKIVSITPSSVVARVEKIASTVVPIKIAYEGKLPLGYSIKSEKIDIQTVKISGPKADITFIKHINTKPIKLSRITESFSRSTDLELPTPNIVLQDFKKAKVDVKIHENVSTKSFRRIKLEVFNCLFRCKVKPPSIRLTLKGPMGILKDLKDKDIQVFIDAAGKSKGKFFSKANIKLPSRTTVEKVSPVFFHLTVF